MAYDIVFGQTKANYTKTTTPQDSNNPLKDAVYGAGLFGLLLIVAAIKNPDSHAPPPDDRGGDDDDGAGDEPQGPQGGTGLGHLGPRVRGFLDRDLMRTAELPAVETMSHVVENRLR